MTLLVKTAEFGASEEELKNIYILFVRSVVEQSWAVWHTSLSSENANDL